MGRAQPFLDFAALRIAGAYRFAPSSTGRKFETVKRDFYVSRPAGCPPLKPEDQWLGDPDAEITGKLSSGEAQYKADRCLSCGLCIGCEQCWMYCNAGGFVRLERAETGTYYALLTDVCEGCGKCIEVCPTGFLSPLPRPG